MTHFVEYDPWVCRNILGKNITTCGYNKKSVVHTGKVNRIYWGSKMIACTEPARRGCSKVIIKPWAYRFL
jgi:hypothetical protein